ncbi:MAG: hypothetical protein ACRDV9_06845 [Acidimicrobiia bacterium]
MTIEWDLSSSHTRRDIGSDQSVDSNHDQMNAVASARITLPDGKVFEADDVQDIRIDFEGDDVETIEVVLNPRRAEEAHRRASALAEQWDLSRRGLDEWLEMIRTARSAGEREADVGQALATDSSDVNGIFHPSVEIRSSFDDDKPSVVAFVMYWVPERDRFPIPEE